MAEKRLMEKRMALNLKRLLIVLNLTLILLFLYLFKVKRTALFGFGRNPNTERLVHHDDFEEDKIPYEKIFERIFYQSDEQLLVNKHVLMLTIKYMIEQVDEDDAGLVEFVRKLIISPERDLKLNLNDAQKKDYSEMGQSGFVDTMLAEMKRGFFVEAGAYDGELNSNSLFFELERNWTGLLIEPIPSNFRNLLNKNRNVYALNACVSPGRPKVLKFLVDGSVFVSRKKRHAKKNAGQKVYVYVPCFSLNTILLAVNETLSVDYLSLDVAGDEYDVIRNLNFDKLKFRALTIKYNSSTDKRYQISQYLGFYGYSLKYIDRQNLYFDKS